MNAENCKEGKKFKNIHTKEIWKVSIIDGKKVFENEKWGDISNYIDMDNFEEI